MTDIASSAGMPLARGARSIPTLPAAGSDAPGRLRRAAPLLILAGFAALGLALGLAAPPPVSPEPNLVLLLRFMAVLKGAAALGAALLVVWRQRRALGSGFVLAYDAGIALMALAPGLIAGLGHVAAGAVSFHAGLVLFAVAALRDDGALPAGARRRVR